jgi:hypothetical protein
MALLPRQHGQRNADGHSNGIAAHAMRHRSSQARGACRGQGDDADARQVLKMIGDEGVPERIDVEKSQRRKERAGEEQHCGERRAGSRP